MTTHLGEITQWNDSLLKKPNSRSRFLKTVDDIGTKDAVFEWLQETHSTLKVLKPFDSWSSHKRKTCKPPNNWQPKYPHDCTSGLKLIGGIVLSANLSDGEIASTHSQAQKISCVETLISLLWKSHLSISFQQTVLFVEIESQRE